MHKNVNAIKIYGIFPSNIFVGLSTLKAYTDNIASLSSPKLSE